MKCLVSPARDRLEEFTKQNKEKLKKLSHSKWFQRYDNLTYIFIYSVNFDAWIMMCGFNEVNFNLIILLNVYNLHTQGWFFCIIMSGHQKNKIILLFVEIFILHLWAKMTWIINYGLWLMKTAVLPIALYVEALLVLYVGKKIGCFYFWLIRPHWPNLIRFFTGFSANGKAC